MAQINPKNVQQAVKVAVALANPDIAEKDWTMLKTRFQLTDPCVDGLKKIITAMQGAPEVKLVLQCLTFNT